jgi:hypothetical protein
VLCLANQAARAGTQVLAVPRQFLQGSWGPFRFGIAKILTQISVFDKGGPFLPRAKKCFTQHSPCKTGLKPAQPATRPVFRTPGWVGAHLRCRARGPWARAPGQRPPATRARARGSRTRDRAPGHQERGHLGTGRAATWAATWAPGTRAHIMVLQLVHVDIMPAPGGRPDYLIIAKG